MKRIRFGLTLVELLVSVAIVLALAAILWPIIANAKYAAKASTSLQSIRQIGLATSMYSSDNDGLLPYAAGNNCYHLALDESKSCGGFSAAQIVASSPYNLLVSEYGATAPMFRSQVDKMQSYMMAEPGHEQTWFEETTTSTYSGSSYEFRTELGLASRSETSFQSPSEVPLVHSLYVLGNESLGSKRHVLFVDSHVRIMAHSKFVDLLVE